MSDSFGSTILNVHNLVVDFPNHTKVLDNVNLSLNQGEILGVIGESGSGKSVLARTLVRMEASARIVAGSIMLDGQELAEKSPKEMREIRGKKIALAIQDPRSAMDPVFRMGNQLREALLSAKELRSRRNGVLEKICRRLAKVGISSPLERCRQYPHEWSRGMLQRSQLVMVFSTDSLVLILDEVTSALDPTVTLQILVLIKNLKKKRNTSIILITHDILIVNELCDRVAVMQNGRIVETGTVKNTLTQPSHPYTQALVSSFGKKI
jgi:ABC-type dipeptide/oligopeptide/nickel transport system ATPase component